MPGFLVNVGAGAMCAHGAPATATVPNPRVTVGGQPTVLIRDPFTVVGCLFNVSGSPSPCTVANWIVGATRISSNGVPLVLFDSQAICVPNGTPLTITVTQVRVKGT